MALRSTFTLLSVLGLLALPAAGPLAAAQDVEAWDQAPAHVALIDGTATLRRDGRVEPAATHVPLLAGDRLTTEVGRLEVLFGDGSALYLDNHTAVDLLSDSLLRLLHGRVRLVIAGEGAVDYRIDAPGASAAIETAGDYRLSTLSGDQVELAVFHGHARLTTPAGEVALGAGERSMARAGGSPAYPQPFNSAYWDAFDRWAEHRRDARLGVASARYLPPEVQAYGGTLDRYGRWDVHPSYGAVWYPAVPVVWRPYYHGRWTHLTPFGWTWIGADPWAWPTHHFGRWGFSAGAWFWIPGRRWAPAWVAWASTPGFVGWCPLGFDGRPVLSVTYLRRFHPRTAWTVVPVRSFAHSVHRVAVAPGVLRRQVTSDFAVHRRAPVRVDTAVPRQQTAVHSAGQRTTGVAVPRGRQTGAEAASGLATPARAIRRAAPAASSTPSPAAGAAGEAAGPSRAVPRHTAPAEGRSLTAPQRRTQAPTRTRAPAPAERRVERQEGGTIAAPRRAAPAAAAPSADPQRRAPRAAPPASAPQLAAPGRTAPAAASAPSERPARRHAAPPPTPSGSPTVIRRTAPSSAPAEAAPARPSAPRSTPGGVRRAPSAAPPAASSSGGSAPARVRTPSAAPRASAPAPRAGSSSGSSAPARVRTPSAVPRTSAPAAPARQRAAQPRATAPSSSSSSSGSSQGGSRRRPPR